MDWPSLYVQLDHQQAECWLVHGWVGVGVGVDLIPVDECLLPFASVKLNPLRPRQNGRHFAGDIFKCIFLNENVWIPITISLKFVPKGPINNIPVLVQIMAWRRPGDKSLSEPMMVSLPTHICVIRPQWIGVWCWNVHSFGFVGQCGYDLWQNNNINIHKFNINRCVTFYSVSLCWIISLKQY